MIIFCKSTVQAVVWALGVAICQFFGAPLIGIGDGAANATEPAQGVTCMAEDPPTRKTLVILVPPGRVEQMQARSFKVQPCAGAEFKIAAYREAMCSYASNGPPAMLAAFANKRGVSAQELCEMAQAIQ